MQGRILATCDISMWRYDMKCKYIFMLLLKNLARKELGGLNNTDVWSQGFRLVIGIEAIKPVLYIIYQKWQNQNHKYGMYKNIIYDKHIYVFVNTISYIHNIKPKLLKTWIISWKWCSWVMNFQYLIMGGIISLALTHWPLRDVTVNLNV